MSPGSLKYTADLTPDNLDPTPEATNTFDRPSSRRRHHLRRPRQLTRSTAAPATTPISGAEALAVAYTNNYDINGIKLNGAAIQTGYDNPFNPGNVLGYQTGGANATKFALYDPANALRKILLNQATGALSWPAAAVEWLLNFALQRRADRHQVDRRQRPTAGVRHRRRRSRVRRPGQRLAGRRHRPRLAVGGAGRRPHERATTVLTTNPTTDTNPSYEDSDVRRRGPCDVLLINTNGDRAIDWVGEFNSYYTPFSQFGMASVLRPDPAARCRNTCLALSKSQGADQTLSAVYGSSPARNGEPVRRDSAWCCSKTRSTARRTGAPRDPQAGNAKGKADVNRSAGVLPIYPHGRRGDRMRRRLC